MFTFNQQIVDSTDRLKQDNKVVLNNLQRPARVQEVVDNVFNNLNKNSTSSWAQNGAEKYKICELDDHLLVKNIIGNSSPQTEFFFLELGGGDFSWPKALRIYLNSSYSSINNYKFNIITVNAEKAKADKIEENGNCTTYQYGNFKLENILSQFNARNLDFEGKIDFVISNFTFRHLVDPLGTFYQVYSSLLKDQGIIAMDGFLFSRLDSAGKEIYSASLKEANLNLCHLLIDLGAEFITNNYIDMRSFDHFIIKKNIDPKEVFLTYSANQSQLPDEYENSGAFGVPVKFDYSGKNKVIKIPEVFYYSWPSITFLGSKKFFDNFKEEEVFTSVREIEYLNIDNSHDLIGDNNIVFTNFDT